MRPHQKVMAANQSVKEWPMPMNFLNSAIPAVAKSPDRKVATIKRSSDLEGKYEKSIIAVTGINELAGSAC